MTVMTDFPKAGVYSHYKGNYYELLYIATDSETLEKKVVYKALYGDGEIWVRPLSMWSEVVLCVLRARITQYLAEFLPLNPVQVCFHSATLPDGTKTKRFTLVEENTKQ